MACFRWLFVLKLVNCCSTFSWRASVCLQAKGNVCKWKQLIFQTRGCEIMSWRHVKTLTCFYPNPRKKLPVSFSGPINLIHLVLHQLISIFVVIFHNFSCRIMSKVICQTREIVCYQSPRHWEESRKDVAQRCIFEEVFWSGVKHYLENFILSTKAKTKVIKIANVYVD